METVTVAIEVPLIGDGRLKNWAKIVSNVDRNGADGWAFDGTFIATGGIQDVEAPGVLLVYGERGSRGSPNSEARVYVINTDATLTLHTTVTGRAWARTLRDTVADLVAADRPILPGASPWDAHLMGYSDAALDQEQARRRRRA